MSVRHLKLRVIRNVVCVVKFEVQRRSDKANMLLERVHFDEEDGVNK